MSATFRFPTTRIPLGQANTTGSTTSTSGRWKRFSRGDCPICAGARKKKDCRQSSSGLVHCRSHAEPPQGWRFVGTDSLGFGMYAQGEGSEQRPIPIPISPRSPRNILSAVERDRQFRQIAKHSGLSQQHRQKLAERGVDEATIETWYAAGFVWSWAFDETVPGTTVELPGIDPATGKLRHFRGMAIAVPSVSGHILGVQIKNDLNQQNYFWGSSTKVGGNNQRLLNGETPLGVYGQISTTLNFAEGYLKPGIAAERHSIFCIGMMGGQWATAPQQLRDTLTAANAQTLILNPDGGAISNAHVLLAYSRLHDLLKSWGYTLQVRWWGQTTKADSDIDEISPEQFQQASIISWWDFKRLWITPEATLQNVKQQLDQAADHFTRHLGYRTPKPIKKNKPQIVNIDAVEIVQPSKTDSVTDCVRECVAIALWTPERRFFLEVTPHTVPEFENFLAMGSPQLIYERHHHNAIQTQLLQKGYPVILANGAGGMGKTHDAGKLAQQWQQVRQEIPGAEQGTLHVVGPNYRNPTTESVERIPERVSGASLSIDQRKITPLGQPHRKRHHGHGPADIPGLCSEDATIQTLQSKGGILIERGYQSDYCQMVCGKAFDCPYLKAQQEQGQPAAIREDINGIRLTKATANNHDHAGDILMVDEAGQTINTVKEVWGSTADISREIGNLAQKNIGLYQRFQPVFGAIAQGLRRAKEETVGHGLSHTELAQFLPSRDRLEAIFWDCVFPQWCDPSENVWGLDLNGLFRQLHWVNNPNQWRDHVSAAVENGFKPSGKTLDDWISSEPLYRTYQAFYTNRLINVRVLGSGAILFSYDNFKIRHTLTKLQSIIAMDATPDPWELSRKIRVPKAHIAQMMPLRPNYSNLTIKIVTGLGKTTFNRAAVNDDGTLKRTGEYDIQNRIVKAVDAIASQCNGSTGLLDAKKFMATYSKIPNLITGYCFNDNRGSNAFKHCDQMISVALPTANIGAKATEYHLLTGKAEMDAGFWAWMQRGQTNEIIQDLYRSRAQHRPDEHINHWLLGSPANNQIETIKRHFPNATIETVDIFQVCPQAAPKGKQTEQAIVKEIWAKIRAGETPTTTDIANHIGRDRSRVSQIANRLHSEGFKGLSKVLVLLSNTLNSKINTPDLDPDMLQLAVEFLPEVARQLQSTEVSAPEAVEYVAAIAESYSDKEFESILAHSPPWAIATLFTEFLPLVGDSAMEWIIADFRELLRRRECLVLPA